jgi:hypothetical protein
MVLMLIGASCLAAALGSHQDVVGGGVSPSLAPESSTTTSAPARAAARPAPDPVVARSVPVLLGIPAIGVQVSLATLGLNPDGTVQVPTDFQQPGWYRFGPSPGQIGSAVILGHVDSYRGPAVFFQLHSLRAGDAIGVTLADGVVAHFVVTAVVTYTKAQFPANLVYASHGYSALQMVTCGGRFDRTSGHYLSNIVVYSTLVATTPATAPAASTTGHEIVRAASRGRTATDPGKLFDRSLA